jgi:large subunit ribosomal protein L24e
MPQNRTCDYCGDDVEPGTGTMFVHTDGSVVHYCSAKCEKNADLGREPRDLEWTEEGGDHGVEADVDEEEETEDAEPETAEVEGEADEDESDEETESEAGDEESTADEDETDDEDEE